MQQRLQPKKDESKTKPLHLKITILISSLNLPQDLHHKPLIEDNYLRDDEI